MENSITDIFGEAEFDQPMHNTSMVSGQMTGREHKIVPHKVFVMRWILIFLKISSGQWNGQKM